MKEEEKVFFKLCMIYAYCNFNYPVRVCDIVDILSDLIPEKRLWYWVRKWSIKGFYNWGTSPRNGWFEEDTMPQIYKNLRQEAWGEYYGRN